VVTHHEGIVSADGERMIERLIADGSVEPEQWEDARKSVDTSEGVMSEEDLDGDEFERRWLTSRGWVEYQLGFTHPLHDNLAPMTLAQAYEFATGVEE
jgi:hypothetical protein